MWFNVKDDENEEKKSVDFEKAEYRMKETIEDVNSMGLDNDTPIMAAKHVELQKLSQFDTYEEVEDHGQKVISTRWVITTKDGSTRARLVARGFEEQTLIPKDSPTVGKGAIRIFLAVAASKNWSVKTTDIKSAFLQGKQLDRDVYIKPPKESNTSIGHVWKLKHGLYGLKDGARQFYMSVRDELLRLGCKQSKLDPAMFTLVKEGSMIGMICTHVDDFLHAGNVTFEEEIMNKLRQRFHAGKIEVGDFKYIGFHIKQTEKGINMDHSEYMEKLKAHIDPSRTTNKQDKLDSSEQTTFRQLVGQLNWAVQGSRPDMAFNMINLSTKLKEGTVADLATAVKLVSRLRDIKSIITFPNLSKTVMKWKILVFTDASLGNLNNGTGSTGAHIIWLVDHEGNCCPITWQANKIKRVVRSTIAAEALSLQEGIEAAYYYRKMLEDILGIHPCTIPITAYIDNKSVTEAVYSTKLVDDKRLRVDIAAIRELLDSNDISEIKWCSGKLQLANCMTKQGASGYELLKVLKTGKMLEFGLC